MSQSCLYISGWGVYHMVEITTDSFHLMGGNCKPFTWGENHYGMNRILTCRYCQHQAVLSCRSCSGSNDFTSLLSSLIWREKPLGFTLTGCLFSVRSTLFGLKACSSSLRENMLKLTGSIRTSKFLLQHVMPLRPSKRFLMHSTEGAYLPVVLSAILSG